MFISALHAERVSREDDGLDELRRRLYAPDVTDADLAAYRAAESAEEPATAVAGTARRLPLAGRAGAIVAATLLVAAGVVAVGIAHPFAASIPAPSPASSTSAGRIAVSADVRDGFIRDLRADVDPGLLAYLDAHPAALLEALRTAGRADSTEFTGVGPSTLSLSPTSAAEKAGHVTVVLVTDRRVAYDWRATTVAVSNDRSGPEPAVAVHAGRADPGAPVSGTVGYSGGVPTRLTLLLSTGVRWAAVVVYTD